MGTGQSTILASKAQIQTATIAIRALTIGNRQMTQSVFRQLKAEPLIDEETAELRGEPWGTVNYFWNGCGLEEKHLHVVWQKGDELRRSCIPPSYHSLAEFWSLTKAVREYGLPYIVASFLDQSDRKSSDWLISIQRDNARGQPTQVGLHHGRIDEFSCSFDLYPVVVGGNRRDEPIDQLRSSARFLANRSFSNDSAPVHQDLIDSASRQWREALPSNLGCENFSELTEYMDSLANQAATIRAEWGRSMERIAELEQLFIAV